MHKEKDKVRETIPVHIILEHGRNVKQTIARVVLNVTYIPIDFFNPQKYSVVLHRRTHAVA